MRPPIGGRTMTDVDVAVVGGGMAGLATAYELRAPDYRTGA